MSKIWYFYPSDPRSYRYILDEITPQLDRAGISFHVCRPNRIFTKEESATMAVRLINTEDRG